MDAILKLLRDKNFHLQKFAQVNATELLNFNADNFDNLEVFYHSRDSILDLIRCIDELVENACAHDDRSVATEAQRNEMRRLLAEKKDTVHAILAQDLEILAVIERAKSNIIHELRDVRASRRGMAGYLAPDVAK